MFSIQQLHENGLPVTRLADDTTGCCADIIPHYGALLNSFSIPLNGKHHNLIEGYASAADYAASRNWFRSAKLSPFACRIAKATYQHNGHTYRVQKFIDRGNALHGLLYDAPFTIAGDAADANGATLTLQYRYTGTDPGYPFRYLCEVVYQLLPQQQLRITTTTTNEDAASIPMMDGWHPYFQLGAPTDELELQFAATHHLVCDALIPTGELKPYDRFANATLVGSTSLDDCFILAQPACVLRNPATGLQLTIEAEANYPYLQLFTPDHRRSIAIENLSAAPDAFNNGMGLLLLQPGESKTFAVRYAVDSPV